MTRFEGIETTPFLILFYKQQQDYKHDPIRGDWDLLMYQTDFLLIFITNMTRFEGIETIFFYKIKCFFKFITNMTRFEGIET